MNLFRPVLKKEELKEVSIPLNERSWSNAIYQKNYYLKELKGELLCTPEAYTWKELYSKGVVEEEGLRIISKNNFQINEDYFVPEKTEETIKDSDMNFKELKDLAEKKEIAVPKSIRSKKELLELIRKKNKETD